jgi:hypothetical protein
VLAVAVPGTATRTVAATTPATTVPASTDNQLDFLIEQPPSLPVQEDC